MSVHSFDTDVAAMVGTTAATIAYNIKHWCEKNAANGKHEHDGRYWTYNSVDAFESLFPYLTKSQIRTALGKLERAGLVLIGEYNKQARDQTKWYSFEPEAVVTIANCEKSQMHLSEIATPFAKNGKPLPDSKPDIKPTTNVVVPAPEPINDVTVAFEAYQSVARKLKENHPEQKSVWPIVQKLTPPRTKALKARLKEHGLEAWGEVLRKAAISDFLCGRTKDWAADFEFLTSPSGFLKTLEGNYDNRDTGGHAGGGQRRAHRRTANAAHNHIADLEEAASGLFSPVSDDLGPDSPFTIDARRVG